MRIAMDSVSWAAIGTLDWPHKIGYVNGHVSAWTGEEIEITRRRGELVALVDTLGTAPLQAAILDVERGDVGTVFSGAMIATWVRIRNDFRHDATIYCAAARIATVLAAVDGQPVNLLVCDLTADGQPPREVPDYGLPDNARLIGQQYVLSPKSGGSYDLSMLFEDAWHPDQHPQPTAGPAQAAAAAVAAPAPAPGTPVEAVPLLEIHHDITATATGPAPLIFPATFASQGPAPDPFSSSSSRSGPDPFSSPGPTHGEDLLARTAAAAAEILHGPTSASPAPVLDHAFIAAVLRDVEQVATMFRKAGKPAAAELLEQAAAHAGELGIVMKLAGL